MFFKSKVGLLSSTLNKKFKFLIVEQVKKKQTKKMKQYKM